MPDALTPKKTVAILGGGPVGLAAPAHVLERGLQPIVLEAGEQAAHAVRQWGHVQLFSPWEYNIDKAAGAAAQGNRLERAGCLRVLRPAASWSSATWSHWQRARRSRTISGPRAASRRSAAPDSTR